MKRTGLLSHLRRALLTGVALLPVFIASNSAFAYERYNDGCMECHGAFTDDRSTKGSIFPEGNKHEMHRNSSYMNTDCNLCHQSGDQKNPYTGSSNGTANNPGLGCTGCHVAAGLRAHHAANNVVDSVGEACVDCHSRDPVPPAENLSPPRYYGTVDTLANNPCNDSLAANTDENWTVGDFVGLDNDGDELYDLADFDCGPPYKMVALEMEGSDVRITWQTVGGRRDILQSTPDLSVPFSDAGTAVDIPGVGIQTTDVVDVGGATKPRRFYRIRYAGTDPSPSALETVRPAAVAVPVGDSSPGLTRDGAPVEPLYPGRTRARHGPRGGPLQHSPSATGVSTNQPRGSHTTRGSGPRLELLGPPPPTS